MRGPVSLRAVVVLGAAACLAGAASVPDDALELVAAAQNGDVTTVRVLIDQGVDVNAAQGDGMTALHWAAKQRDADLTELLLESGADPRAMTRIGSYTPLHLAARGGGAATVQALLEAGSDPTAATTNSGAQPIHLASASGNPHAVRLLLQHGADPNAREGSWDQTPLVFAAANNRPLAIEALLEGGADPSVTTRAVDVRGRARVDQKANEKLDEVLEEFRQEAGGGGDWEPSPEQVRTAIEAAREIQRNMDPAELLAEEEAEEGSGPPSYAELVGSWGGLTPLLHAARQGHREAVLALFEGGAGIDQVSAGDRTTPLLMATLNGHFDLAALLIEVGADVNLASDAGATPLHAVLEREWLMPTSYSHPLHHFRQNTTHLELMEKLLEAGADPNARLTRHLWYIQYTFDRVRMSFEGATPFWRAAFALDLDAMKLLMEHGADPDIWTKRGPDARMSYSDAQDDTDHSGVPPVPVSGPAMHPIHAASGVGYGEGYIANVHRHVPDGWLPVLRYLVEELGADVNARDHNGYTPLHHAASRGDNEAVRYLVEQGADVTVVSRDGQTTVDMANGPFQRIQPFPRTIELLESLGAHNNNNCVSC